MQFCFVCLFFLQSGKWVDRMCSEKKDFICMKTSASTPTGEEVLQDVGCKIVCCLYLFVFYRRCETLEASSFDFNIQSLIRLFADLLRPFDFSGAFNTIHPLLLSERLRVLRLNLDQEP